MAWVEFIADYVFTPDEDRRSSVKYRAGYAGSVRKQCADKAVAAGAARRRRTPQRDGDVDAAIDAAPPPEAGS